MTVETDFMVLSSLSRLHFSTRFSRVLFTAALSCAVCSGATLKAVDCNLPWEEYKAKTLEVLPTLDGWCTPEKATRMMEIIKKTKPRLYVEIGVYGGSSFLPATAAMQFVGKGTAYAIDPWAVPECLEGMEGANYEWWSKIDLTKIMNGFMSKMHQEKLDNRYITLRMSSKEAIKQFRDNSIGVLHVDGNHSEESAYYDVTQWLPKVKSGGYLIFDDANWPQTKKAVKYLFDNCTLDSGSTPNDPYLIFIKK